MAGFSNEVVYATNVNFTNLPGSARVSPTITTDGQLIIGSTALNAGGTHINIGNITSPLGTLTIGYSTPNITIDLAGGSTGIDSIAVDTTTGAGTNPVVPTAAGLVTISGGQYPTGTFGTRVITIVSDAANQLRVEAQISSAVAATNITKNGLAHFDSALFTVDANGFVSNAGTGFIKTLTGDSGGARSPTAGNMNIVGGSPAAGASPVAVAGAASTLTVNVQKSQAIAATDATKVGLSNFDSARFTVDANGFVSINGSGVAETITGDSGGALSPTAGNWNILGRSGSKTSGSGSTLTVKSPPYADAGGSATSTLNSGSFVTGAFTLTLPASAGLADGDLFEYVATSAAIYVIQAVGTQKIRIGNTLSSAAGAATSDGLAGTALVLRFRASDGFFYALSTIGTFVLS